MKRRIGGYLALFALAALLWGGWLSWQSWKVRQTLNALTTVAQSADLEALLRGKTPEARPHGSSSAPNQTNTPETDPNRRQEPAQTVNTAPSPDSKPHAGETNSVDQAIRGIDLSQGEDGVEMWRLHADWATLRQESGQVEVRDPHVRYALGAPRQTESGLPFFEDDQYMDVTALTGRVEDNNTRITMDGDVRAEYRDEVLTGPYATFRNDERTLVFPRGAELAGPRMSGMAGILHWNLTTNILNGQEGVQILWTPAAAVKPDATHSALPHAMSDPPTTTPEVRTSGAIQNTTSTVPASPSAPAATSDTPGDSSALR